MCNKLEEYEKLIANLIHSGQYLFEFKQPIEGTNLGEFYILEENQYCFLSDYLINDECEIRINLVNDKKKLIIDIDKINPKPQYEILNQYLYISIADFQRLLSSGLFDVVEN